MIVLRAFAGLHDLATLIGALRLGRFQLGDLAADWFTNGAFTRYRDRAAHLEAQQAHLPSEGCAWTGPWPPGALPVTAAYGDGNPIFVGYLDVSNPATRRQDIAVFWRHVADLFDADPQDTTR